MKKIQSVRVRRPQVTSQSADPAPAATPPTRKAIQPVQAESFRTGGVVVDRITADPIPATPPTRKAVVAKQAEREGSPGWLYRSVLPGLPPADGLRQQKPVAENPRIAPQGWVAVTRTRTPDHPGPVSLSRPQVAQGAPRPGTAAAVILLGKAPPEEPSPRPGFQVAANALAWNGLALSAPRRVPVDAMPKVPLPVVQLRWVSHWDTQQPVTKHSQSGQEPYPLRSSAVQLRWVSQWDTQQPELARSVSDSAPVAKPSKPIQSPWVSQWDTQALVVKPLRFVPLGLPVVMIPPVRSRGFDERVLFAGDVLFASTTLHVLTNPVPEETFLSDGPKVSYYPNVFRRK